MTADLRELARRTEPRLYRNAQGETLPYRLLLPPAYDPRERYPLILFLHGAGERGDDNTSQLKNPDALALVTAEVAQRHPAIFVAPQCPAESWWAEFSWRPGDAPRQPRRPSHPMRLVIELLDTLPAELSIDADRGYVTGLSMGGFGTVDLCLRRPHDFAAAVVVCGGGDTTRAAEVAHIAWHFFHGADDDVVPVALSRSLVEALRRAGGQPLYTEYPGVKHHSWVPAYSEPGLAEWLFAQARK